MAYDALLALQAQVTKTATFNGAGLALANGTPTRGLVARVFYNISAATATATATFSIDHSADAGTTWSTLASHAPVTGSTGTTSTANIPFITPLSARGNPNEQIRLTMTLAGGTTPSVIYSGEIGGAMP